MHQRGECNNIIDNNVERIKGCTALALPRKGGMRVYRPRFHVCILRDFPSLIMTRERPACLQIVLQQQEEAQDAEAFSRGMRISIRDIETVCSDDDGTGPNGAREYT